MPDRLRLVGTEAAGGHGAPDAPTFVYEHQGLRLAARVPITAEPLVISCGGLTITLTGERGYGQSGGVSTSQDAPAMRLAPGAETTTPTVAELIAEFVAFKRTTSTTDGHPVNVERNLRKACQAQGWKFPKDITAKSVREYLMHLTTVRRPNGKVGVGAKARNDIRGDLFGFCKQLVADKLLPENLVAEVQRARVVRTAARYVPTIDEVRALIMAAIGKPQKRDRWAAHLLRASTGIRVATAKKLRWEHCKIDGPGFPHLEMPGRILKGKDPKRVWLTREAAEVLLALRSRSGGRHLVFESVGSKKENFDADLRAAKLLRRPHQDSGTFTPHSLRHFCSNRMNWASRFTDKERQQQNGHDTLAMTMRTYTEASHVGLAEKIYTLEPLLPPGVMGPPEGPGPGKSPKTPGSPSCNPGGDGDTGGARSEFGPVPEPHSEAPRDPQGSGLANSLGFIHERGAFDGGSKVEPRRRAEAGSDRVTGSNPVTLTSRCRNEDSSELPARSSMPDASGERAVPAASDGWRFPGAFITCRRIKMKGADTTPPRSEKPRCGCWNLHPRFASEGAQ